MKATIQYGIIGYGNIGQGLHRFLSGATGDVTWNVRWVARRSGVYAGGVKVAEPTALCEKAFVRDLDIVFIAIPSEGFGRDSYHYLRFFLRAGIPVITCEKAALADNFWHLYWYYRDLLRYNATVGGGSGILAALSADPWGIVELRGVVNTTLNVMRQAMGKGMILRDAIEHVRTRQLVETGNGDASTLLNAELWDTFLKGMILLHTVACTVRHPVSVPLSRLRVPVLSLELFEEAFSANRVCTITILRKGTHGYRHSSKSPWPFCCCNKGWMLEVRFAHPSLLPFSEPLGTATIVQYRNRLGETRVLSGEGAGVLPTVRMMYSDARELLCLREPCLRDCQWI